MKLSFVFLLMDYLLYEFIVLGSNPNLSKIKTHSITVGEHQIRRSNQVRNIGAIFDANAKMEGQVTKTCQTAWFHLYTISKISQYLTKEQKQTIIHAYVTPRLDQNNSLLGGLPLTQMNKLQLVQNSAAKIILGGKKTRPCDRPPHQTTLAPHLPAAYF